MKIMIKSARENPDYLIPAPSEAFDVEGEIHLRVFCSPAFYAGRVDEAAGTLSVELDGKAYQLQVLNVRKNVGDAYWVNLGMRTSCWSCYRQKLITALSVRGECAPDGVWVTHSTSAGDRVQRHNQHLVEYDMDQVHACEHCGSEARLSEMGIDEAYGDALYCRGCGTTAKTEWQTVEEYKNV